MGNRKPVKTALSAMSLVGAASRCRLGSFDQAALQAIGRGCQFREKLVEPLDGMLGDAGKHVGEPRLWVELFS